MRVLIILREFYCPSKPIGGAERQALKLAKRLLERGVAVTVVTGLWDWGQPRRGEIDQVPVHRHFTAWGMLNIKGLRRFGQYIYLLTLFLYLALHRDEYDIIHCHSALFEASVVTWAGQWLDKKTLVRSMASGPWGDIRRLREERKIRGTKWMLGQIKEADSVVALNTQVSEELIQVGVSPERIMHIPNGVETERIERKTDYGLGQEPTIVFVGRLHPQKGIDVLLMALKRVRESLPQFSWHLKLVGEGRQRSELETMAQQMFTGQEVEFLGQVTDPFPLFEQSDMFVLPSRSVGMSNALLEAMAHGLPCVVSDIPGNNEIVTHGKDGLLVCLDDAAALANAISSLVLEPEWRARLGHAAARTVEEKYSLNSVASQYMALYARLLSGRQDLDTTNRTQSAKASDTEDSTVSQAINLAYISQVFPALTQTFVYRETMALQEMGFDVVTSAIWKPEKNKLSQESRHLVDSTLYVFPISWPRFLKAHLNTLVTRPGRYIGTLVFILTRKGESRQNRRRTLYHFLEAISLAPELKKRKVQHIHSHFAINAATIALVLSRLLGISFSFTAHNIFFVDQLLLKEKVQAARFVVAISEFSKQFLLRLVPGEHLGDKIHVVHCGLSPEDFAPTDHEPKGEVPLLLFVAQLAERKGAPVLVEACRLLAERGLAFRCVIIGDGPQKALVERLVGQYALEDIVELTGALPQEAVKSHLERADVFVLPCIKASNNDMDGIPVSLMEAMAMEIPTVSTHVSGIPELIEDGKSGLLVDEKDVEALADVLQRLLENKALRAELGKNARLRIIREFDIHTNVAELATLFRRYVAC